VNVRKRKSPIGRRSLLSGEKQVAVTVLRLYYNAAAAVFRVIGMYSKVDRVQDRSDFGVVTHDADRFLSGPGMEAGQRKNQSHIRVEVHEAKPLHDCTGTVTQGQVGERMVAQLKQRHHQAKTFRSVPVLHNPTCQVAHSDVSAAYRPTAEERSEETDNLSFLNQHVSDMRVVGFPPVVKDPSPFFNREIRIVEVLEERIDVLEHRLGCVFDVWHYLVLKLNSARAAAFGRCPE
jgi:hypothetical protein